MIPQQIAKSIGNLSRGVRKMVVGLRSGKVSRKMTQHIRLSTCRLRYIPSDKLIKFSEIGSRVAW